MSEENVELARQYFEGLNAEGPHGARHMRHPDIEVIDPPNFPDADRWVGEAAVWERVESFVEIGWDGQFRVEEYLDAGEEVVVVWRALGHSRHGGGVPLDVTMVQVLLFEGDKIRRIRQYLSRAEALEAAGLRE
jgi:ketosteroid isomerase-like protein